MREIINPVLSLTGWAALVSIVYRSLQLFGHTNIASKMTISSSPHSYLVSSLGLLLVFKTNSAYNRFSEGRKIWEDILSISRNLTRFINLYENEIGSARVKRVKNLLASYPYLLRHHIRPRCADPAVAKMLQESGYGLPLREPIQTPLETRFEGDQAVKASGSQISRTCWVDRRNLPWSLLPNAILEHVAVADNRPLWVCDHISKELVSVPYGDNFTSRERLTLVTQVEKLTNSIGACERIHQTTVPLNYARHSLRSLTLWLVTLPFAIVKDLGLLTAPVMGVTAWLMFGVYQIGYSIEDPFQGSLRLSSLCDSIRQAVLGDIDKVGGRNSAFSLGYNWREQEFTSDVKMKSLEDIVGKATIERLECKTTERDEIAFLIRRNTTDTGSWM